MTKKSVSVDKAFEQVKAFPLMEASEYAHGKAYSNIKLPAPDRVATELTLEQVTAAFISGEKIKIEYVTHYHYSYVSTYDYSSKERSFMSTGGSVDNLDSEKPRKVVAVITEHLCEAKVQVVSLTKNKTNSRDSVETWSAVLVETGWHESNYYGGDHEWTKGITVIFDGKELKWVNKVAK